MKKVLVSWMFWMVVLVAAGVAYHFYVVGDLKSSIATAQTEVTATAERGVALGNSAHERLDRATELMTSLKGEVDSKATKAELKAASDKLADYDDFAALQEKVNAIDEKVNPPQVEAESVDGPNGDEASPSAPDTAAVAEACKAEYTKLGFSSAEAQAACQ